MARTVTTRIVEEVTIPRYKASVQWYGPPDDEGWRTTGWRSCDHYHTTWAGADRCKDVLARRIETTWAGADVRIRG